MSLPRLLNEIISQKKYIHLPNELGAWTDPLNDKIKDYIWEADYISKVYKKETLDVSVTSSPRSGLNSNVTFIGSHELAELNGVDPMNLIDVLVDAREYIQKHEDIIKGLRKFYWAHRKDIKKKQFKTFVDTLVDMEYDRPSLYKMIEDMVLKGKNLPKMQYPIVASVKEKTILFDHSLYYFMLEMFDGDFYNNRKSQYFEKSERFGCSSRSQYRYPLTVVNIDQPYSLDEEGQNPYPVEKAQDQNL